MAASILVVDRNEAFATMLEHMLTADGGYDVRLAHGSREALSLLRDSDFDLTILDVDLGPGETDYQDLVRGVRQARPSMRVMLIPLMGSELPSEAGQLDIQGTLTKPFFADDLLPNIEDALSKQSNPPVAQPQPAVNEQLPPAERSQPLPSQTPETSLNGASSLRIRPILIELAREITADLVLLISISSQTPNIVASVSTLSSDSLENFSELVVATLRAAQATARFLGQPDEPFVHNMFEGDGLRFYTLVLSRDLLLAVTTPQSTPLGMIRHNLRRAGRELAGQSLT